MSDRAPTEQAEALEGAAPIVGWIGTALGSRFRDPAQEQEARDAAADLAEELAEFAPGELQAVQWAKWPAPGFVPVLAALPADALANVATAIAGGATDRATLHELCAEALRQAIEQAPEAAAVLRPASVASTLAVAYHATGPGAAFVQALSEGVQDGPRPLESLLQALSAAVTPSEVSRLIALLHDAAAARFGGAPALALARGHLFVRLIAPALETAGRAQAAASLREQANGEAGTDGMDAFVGQVVAAGRQAELIAADGEDPDDVLVQRGAALASELDLLLTFAEPTPPDPLGTMPAIGPTALGQAILRARQQRKTDYDWSAVKQVEAEDPDGLAILMADERYQVLDRAAELAGIRLE